MAIETFYPRAPNPAIETFNGESTLWMDRDISRERARIEDRDTPTREHPIARSRHPK